MSTTGGFFFSHDGRAAAEKLNYFDFDDIDDSEEDNDGCGGAD